MELPKMNCPHCASKRVEAIGAGRHYCNSCHHGFLYEPRSDIGKPNPILQRGDVFGYQGKVWVCLYTQMKGGGTAHGPGDVYPDGHHVTARGMETGEEIYFYQTGSFMGMPERGEITLLGRAKDTWEMVSD